MSESVTPMGEAIEAVLLFREQYDSTVGQQDTSMLPEAVRSVDNLDKLPLEYALLAASGLSNIFMPGALPINLDNPRDVRYLTSEYYHAIEHKNARTDQLTGLMNRAGLQEWLEQNYDENKNTYGILAVDLTDFKAVNDTLGHDAGDVALVQFADVVREFIRISSATESAFSHERQNSEHKDVLARTGGDEFYIVMDLDGVTLVKAQEIIKRVIASIEGINLAVRGRSGESRSHGIRIDGVISTPQNPIPYAESLKMADDLCNGKRSAEKATR